MSSRLLTIAITAAICLPLGALLQRDAVAERRNPAVFGAVIIAEHPRLTRAQAALHQGLDEIRASEAANELLWTDRTGRAYATRAALAESVRLLDDTVSWLRNGMARQADATLGSDAGALMRPAPYLRTIAP